MHHENDGISEDRIFVVIPVYNHVSTLRDVAVRSLAVHPHVMVVDDGSTDGGADSLEGLPVEILRHPENLGKGAAILSAAARAKQLEGTHIITIDADGQHDPEEIPRFLEAIKVHPLAILVGKRDFEETDLPRGRRFGRAFSNFWLRVQTGRSIGDAQSGFRAYPVDVLKALRLQDRRFSFEIEVLAKAAWGGIEWMDIDISVHYPPAHERVSHFRMFMDNMRLTRLNTRLTMRSMFPWPHRKLLTDDSSPSPKISLLHPVKAMRSLLTGDNSPQRLAAAGALGVFLGALPLIAFHTAAILFSAGYLRLNKIAAVTASQLCMPPIVPALCIEVGYFIRHGSFLTEISLKTLGYQALERILEWFLGSLIVGPALAVVVGGIIYAAGLVIKLEKPH
jgi:glycosyltransferase involved in cell wall biosynthesis